MNATTEISVSAERARVINGKACAERVRAEVSRAAARIHSTYGIQPGLAVILIGDDPASRVYVKRKTTEGIEAGLRVLDHVLPASVSEDGLLELITDLNGREDVHGILVQLPLPVHIDKNAVLKAIRPEKDVDGFHPANAGLLATGERTEAMVPCTPLGCLRLLKKIHPDLTGLNALVVGCSNIVGRPMSQLLLEEQCTVSIAHLATRNLPELCSQADILIVAAGAPELIQGAWIKPGATVIDVGINRIERDAGHRLVGDVAFDQAVQVAGAITPVPGGVGPMTIAYLLSNTVTAAHRLLAKGG